MKTLLLTLTFLGLLSLGIQAQSRFGFEIGYHNSNVNYPSNAGFTIGAKPSFHLGILGYIPLSNRIFFNPGLTLLDKSFNLRDSFDEYLFTPVTIELPVNILYRIPIHDMELSFGPGLYADAGVSGNITTDSYYMVNNVYYNDSHKIRYGNNEATNDLKRFNAGYRFNAGFLLNKHFKAVSYFSNSITNIFPKGDVLKGKSQIIAFGVQVIL